nr:Condensin complex subunit 2 [Hymenolepis microstoma]
MFVAERGVNSSLANNIVTFADEPIQKSDGKSRKSLRFNDLDDSFLGLNEQNNDDVERIARRRSRLLEPHPEVINSPAHDTARRAIASQPVPRTQVGEHYGNCIRLAAENKITYKNAFDLHLIDYMGEMIKKEDFTSFRMASSSLDASAKIYAGRVDAVHQETYKVLTGLGRSDKPSKANRDCSDEDNQAPCESDDYVNDIDGEACGRRKKDRRHISNSKKVIATSLTKIRSKVKGFEADVDPLFQQQAAAYDDGGTVELSLNRLRTRSKFSELLQDSNTPLFDFGDSTSVICCTKSVELYPPIDSRTFEAPLCVAFDNFRFNDDEQSVASIYLDPITPVTIHDDHLANNETAAPPISPPLMDMDDDNNDTAMPLMNGVEDDNDITIVNEGHDKFAGGEGVQVVNAEPEQLQEPTLEGELFVSSLKSMLTAHLENFGHVNDGVLGLWAGPEHWRKKAKRRRLDEFGNAAPFDNEENEVTTVGKSSRTKTAKKSKPTTVEYVGALLDAGENRSRSGFLVRNDWSKELEQYTKDSGKSTILREQNLRLAGERFNILPPSITDARQNIYELFNREVMRNIVDPKITETQENATAQAMAEGGIVPPWLDSQAAAAVAAEDGVHDDDEAGDIDHMPVDEDDDDIAPYDGIFTQQGAIDNIGIVPMEDGMQLVAPPRQVARLEIGYARAAKLINVRHLKSVLWEMIGRDLAASSDRSPPTKKPRPDIDTNEEGTADTSQVKSAQEEYRPTCCFSDILTSLPARVSKNTASELSVAIGLNCLLHLANEKDLFLETGEGCIDLLISQGLSTSELEMISQYQRSSRVGEQRSKKQVSLDRWLENSRLFGQCKAFNLCSFCLCSACAGPMYSPFFCLPLGVACTNDFYFGAKAD